MFFTYLSKNNQILETGPFFLIPLPLLCKKSQGLIHLYFCGHPFWKEQNSHYLLNTNSKFSQTWFRHCIAVRVNHAGICQLILLKVGILSLFPLPTKSAKSHPWAETSNFPPFSVNSLLKFSAHFAANGTKVKIPPDINPIWHGRGFCQLIFFSKISKLFWRWKLTSIE